MMRPAQIKSGKTYRCKRMQYVSAGIFLVDQIIKPDTKGRRQVAKLCGTRGRVLLCKRRRRDGRFLFPGYWVSLSQFAARAVKRVEARR